MSPPSAERRRQASLLYLSIVLVALTFLVKIGRTIWINGRFEMLERGHDGILKWKAMIPGGDGIIHLGAHHQPYGISMFHQLRCLDIIRDETVRNRSNGDNISDIGRHCLNYIRQMVMCRGDLELKSFQFASHKNPVDLFGVYECKDWEGFIIL
ncbi:hypothetical protein K443DRAFT_131789 [Laccaria amethystina LaAM-08-1]|uniref:Uncharacterized protein n=1 Tax=Laccaria amethystina LaAM-08-1 TaxID=1095629 RepID=A0A0C9Y341_9AGAR|nr:hypothetical protein K443DRAFT_134872 [Laccaria amethystina LaAM-08-1]KIK02513.1 hypothetical protein K443DRAFT_131789 [Laccaria amethystina LaAM-08-1]